jgi:hypothetical protein
MSAAPFTDAELRAVRENPLSGSYAWLSTVDALLAQVDNLVVALSDCADLATEGCAEAPKDFIERSRYAERIAAARATALARGAK